MGFLTQLLETIFPDYCIGCHTPGTPLCEMCIGKVERARLGMENGNSALFAYKNPLIQKSLWALKYRQKKTLARVFAEYLYEELVTELAEEVSWRPGESPKWILLPIPASKKRARRRGYNQAAELARHIAEKDQGRFLEYHENLLIKTRETESQDSMKDRAARLLNVQDSFSVQNETALVGRSCVVIDDVTTTGATLEEARRALLTAGAEKVLGLTVAT